MTCVIALKNEKSDEIVLASDSAMAYSGNDYFPQGCSKVGKNEKHDFFWGFSGWYKTPHLMRYKLNPIIETVKTSYTEDSDFINEILYDSLCAFTDLYFSPDDNDDKDDPAYFSLILIKDSRIYTFCSMGKVLIEYDELISIGSGSTAAMGSILTTQKLDLTISDKDKVLVALEVAANTVFGVSAPFELIVI